MSVEVAETEDDRPGANLIGQVLANRYQIESRLGEGAMGSVFKAKHVKVGRPFAVKVLHKKLYEDRKVLQRFEREAELAGRLRHPNVVGVVDVGETADGFRYMVMDFAEGDDLATMLNEAPMTPERIVNLTRQMLEGLYHAHEQGLIHRDFKPENVIIERDDHGKEVPRIVDFGIAILREGGESANSTGRLTTNGLVLGTPHYMAPEQAVADPIDHRIDLFALGIVIYEMLCGKLPFDGTGAEVARANLLLDPPVISQRVPFLEVDPLLEAYCRRLLAKKRELRPATAKAARELLDLIVNDPDSAAAALGVPLGSSARQPAITQPTTPVVGSPEDMLDAAIEVARPMPTPVPVTAAPFEAPAYPTPPPTDLPRRGQQSIRTDAAAPLRWQDEDVPPAQGRGKLIAIALGVIALAGVIAFVAVRSGGDDKKIEEPTKVVMQADPPNKPDPKPVDPPKQPDLPNVVADVPVVDPPIVDDPPVVGVVKPKVLPKVPVKKPETVTVKVEEPKPTPPEPPPADPTVTKTVLTANAVYALYQAVGSDLKALAKSHPMEAAGIETDYRRIQIQNAMATEESRERSGAELQKMATRITVAKSKKP